MNKESMSTDMLSRAAAAAARKGRFAGMAKEIAGTRNAMNALRGKPNMILKRGENALATLENIAGRQSSKFQAALAAKNGSIKLACICGLFNELEKIAERSLLKDFAAGADPTGVVTSRYGMDDVKSGRGHSRAAQIAGDVGGTIGGAVAVPLVIGGMVGAVKGAATAKGGLKGRLTGALRGAGSGAISPYKSLFHATRGGKGLKAVQEGKAMSGSQAKSLHTLVKDSPGLDSLAAQVSPAQLQSGIKNLKPDQLDKLRRTVSGEAAQGGAALGISGLIGAAGAHLQYGKGVETQSSVNDQISKYRPTSQTTPMPMPRPGFTGLRH